MAISSNRYVNIDSGVGGGNLFPTKELLLRLFSTNARIPTGSVLSFSSSSLDSSLKDYFGSGSEEYKQAAFYFGFISKSITSPKNIQFARWAESDTAAMVFGSQAATLAVLKGFAAGAFDVTIGGTTTNVTPVDMSGALTYSAVASTLQAAIILAGIANATVSYDAERGSFDFDSGATVNGEISITTVTPGLTDALGWGDSAIFSAGIAAQSIADVLGDSTTVNNNYGSYAFVGDLSSDEILESAIFVNGRNIEYQYYLPVLDSNRTAIAELIESYASCGMVMNSITGQYPWLLPAAILGSLDYDKPAASANFMYYQSTGLTASITDDAQADVCDALKVNYYGATQENGANISFFQRGVLTGNATAPKTMGVHANEQWLKAYLKHQFLSMFIAMQQVPADEVGQAMGLTYIDGGIAKATMNGSISTGKLLTVTQRNYITQLSGDPEAWQAVQSRGYWYTLSTDAENNTMDYLLIYSKRDSVDKVNGRHSLI